MFSIFSVLLAAVVLQTASCQGATETPQVCRPLSEVCGLSGKGEKGEPGSRGSMGSIGKAGPPGEKGNIGLKGEKGDTGSRGSMGSIGNAGPRGEKGSIGPKGEKGDTGALCDMSCVKALQSELADLQQFARATKTGSPADMSHLSSLERKVTELEGIMRFQGVKKTTRTYFFTNGKKMTPEDGKAECSAAGGRLASPRDSSENLLVFQFVKQYSHRAILGITNIAVEGRHVYSNGEPIVYSKWGTFQPDNYGNSEDCTEMLDDGTWNDISCNKKIL